MYRRKETIEEEHLEWGKPLKRASGANQNIAAVLKPRSSKKFSDTLKSGTSFINTTRKKKFEFVINEDNIKLTSFVMGIIVPYIIGFTLLYVIFFAYGGMSLLNYITRFEKFYEHFELWSVGAYLLIVLATLAVVFITFKKFLFR